MTRFLIPMFVLLCFVGSIPARAQIGFGGGTTFRREVHEDFGDFRFTAELFADSRDRSPYWGYLAVSKELLLAPNVGTAELGFVLVTEDGKPVEEARWSEDHMAPYDRWEDLRLQNGRWILPYRLEGTRAGTRTIFFAGKIKKGKRSYTKLFLLFDITIGRKKDRRQADALQFMVYSLNLRGGIDPQTLVNSQESMGAGGKPLIGPEIVEEEEPPAPRRRREPETDAEQPRPLEGDCRVEIRFQGFASWVRIDWTGASSQFVYVEGLKVLVAPRGCQTFDLYICAGQGDRGGCRVKCAGKLESFKLLEQTTTITVTRTVRQ